MVAKGMHKLASEGPKQAVQSRDVRWLSGNSLRTLDPVLGYRTGGGSLEAACDERESGCGSVCTYLPYAPPARENYPK